MARHLAVFAAPASEQFIVLFLDGCSFLHKRHQVIAQLHAVVYSRHCALVLTNLHVNEKQRCSVVAARGAGKWSFAKLRCTRNANNALSDRHYFLIFLVLSKSHEYRNTAPQPMLHYQNIHHNRPTIFLLFYCYPGLKSAEPLLSVTEGKHKSRVTAAKHSLKKICLEFNI